MKKLLCKILAFASITLVCLLAYNGLTAQAGRLYKDGASIICEQKRIAVREGDVRSESGKDNVLFLGHSTILAGLVPEQFDAADGRTFSWNLSLPALPIGPHYFLLKEYLEHNPAPRYIILKLSASYGAETGLFDKYAAQGASAEEMWSYAIDRPNKNAVWNYCLPMRLYRDDAMKYMRKSLIAPQDVQAQREQNQAIVEKMFSQRGYYFIREQTVPGGRLWDDYREATDGKRDAGEAHPDRDPYVRSFFDLARERDIQVLLIEDPVRAAKHPQRTAMPVGYRMILDRYDNVHMASGGWKFRMYENRFFGDPTHVNPEGAARFTREVYAEFAEVFGR